MYDSTAEQPGRNKRDQLTNILDTVSSEIEDIRYNTEHMKNVMAALEGIEQRNPPVPGMASALNADEIREFLRMKREQSSPSVPSHSPTTAPGNLSSRQSNPASLTDVSSTDTEHMLVDSEETGTLSQHSDTRHDLTDVSSGGLSLVDSTEDGEEGPTSSDIDQAPVGPAFNPPSSPRTFLLPPRISHAMSAMSTLTTLSSGSSSVEASMPYATPDVAGPSYLKNQVSSKTYRPTRRSPRWSGAQANNPSPSSNASQDITPLRPRPAPRGRGRIIPMTSVRGKSQALAYSSSAVPPNRAYVSIPSLQSPRPRDPPAMSLT